MGLSCWEGVAANNFIGQEIYNLQELKSKREINLPTDQKVYL